MQSRWSLPGNECWHSALRRDKWQVALGAGACAGYHHDHHDRRADFHNNYNNYNNNYTNYNNDNYNKQLYSM